MERSRSPRINPRKATSKPGKREANKLDKLERVKRAARQLFTTVGYDEATTRQIAKKAGVALGTVLHMRPPSGTCCFWFRMTCWTKLATKQKPHSSEPVRSSTTL